MNRSRALMAGLAAIVLFAAAACSSSGDSGSPSGGSASSGGTGSKLNGTPITFAALCPESQPNQPECWTAQKAVFDEYNDQGGFQGHPLQLEHCDTANNANIPSCLQKYANNKSVIAFTGNDQDAGISKVLSAQGMASIGSGVVSNDEATSPNAFNWSVWGAGSAPAAARYWVQSNDAKSAKPIAAFVDIEAGRAALGGLQQLFTASGGSKIAEAPVSLTDTSFQPIAARVASNKNDPIMVLLTGDQTVAMLKAANGFAVAGTFISAHSSCADEKTLKSVGKVAGKGLLCGVEFNWEKRDQVAAVMDKYGPKDWDYGFEAVKGYLAAKMAIASLKLVKGGVTRASFLAAVKTLKFSDPLLIKPVDFSSGKGPVPQAPSLYDWNYNVYLNTDGKLVKKGSVNMAAA